MDGTYQEKKTRYINDSTGFRPDLVRMNNEIDFKLFRKLHAGDVFAGYDDYLFSKGYEDEYDGTAYLGTDAIRDELIRLKLVQDTLERLGKTFIFAYAPSKQYIYPDKIPDILRKDNKIGTTTYRTFRRIGDSLHIRQLDFNALFMAMRDTAHAALITKQGCHWSIYGGLLAADTIVKYIEHARHITMPELVITKSNYSTVAIPPDNDLATCTNLIYPYTKETFYYPEFHYSIDSAKTKPKTIFIGDSFVWPLIGNGLLLRTMSDWEYWSYCTQVWREKETPPPGYLDIDSYDWHGAIMRTDCIIILYTTINLNVMNQRGQVIERMYNYFYPQKGKGTP